MWFAFFKKSDKNGCSWSHNKHVQIFYRNPPRGPAHIPIKAQSPDFLGRAIFTSLVARVWARACEYVRVFCDYKTEAAHK